ncbi:MAG: RNA methyltransferase [Ignavibacteriales bacterium]|nr:RNA methyltransferase [Ignavibacteriales bacterium]
MRISKSQLTLLRQLKLKKERDVRRMFLVEGWRGIAECRSAGVVPTLVAYDPRSNAPDHRNLLAEFERNGATVVEVGARDLNSIADTVHSQGIVAAITQRNMPEAKELLMNSRFVVVLDRITDPGNLGTILRTCDWFGIDLVLVSRGSVSIFNEKVVRSTVGSILRLNVLENIDPLDALSSAKEMKYDIFSTGMTGTDVRGAVHRGKFVLLLGNEAHGVDARLSSIADRLISIPKRGSGESLNVAVAAGIVLEHLVSFRA